MKLFSRILFLPFLFSTISITAISQKCITQKDSTGNSYSLNSIHFKFDRWEIDSTTYACLDSLVIFLKERDSLIIQIKCHIDVSDQDARYSKNISVKQANEIVNYLVLKGISNARLIPTGMGKTEPIYTEIQIKKMKTKAEQMQARNKNRRCEFKILSSKFKSP